MWAGTLTVAAGHPIHDEPPDVGHAGVMVDVEEGDLMVVLPQDEENGVHELDELGEVVHQRTWMIWGETRRTPPLRKVRVTNQSNA